MEETTVASPDTDATTELAAEPVVEQKQEVAAAEPKNTDTKPPAGYVPLQALHEARDQLKALKDSQDWRGYSKLKEALDADPNFAQHFINAVQGYYNKEQKDPYAEYPQEIAEPLRKTQMLEQTVQQMAQTMQQQQSQAVFQQYKSALAEKIKDLPTHWRGYFEKRAIEEGTQLNPQALQAYDPQLVDRVYEAVSQEVESIRREERGSYVTEKKNDKLPVSSQGSAGQVIQKPQSAEDRTRMAEELLKAALA